MDKPAITGAELIAQERGQHIAKHKKDVRYDIDNNKEGQLTQAARCLLMAVPTMNMMPTAWTDKDMVRKMIAKSYPERLILAGALIAAEIDRVHELID